MRIFRSDRARRLRDPTKHAVSLVGSKECVEYDNVRLSSLRARAPARRALPLSRHVLLQLLDELRRDLDVPNLGTRRASAAPRRVPRRVRAASPVLAPAAPRRHHRVHKLHQLRSVNRRGVPAETRAAAERDPVPKPPSCASRAPVTLPRALLLGVPVRRRGVGSCPSWRTSAKSASPSALRRSRRRWE